jgi:two-component system chemotaxis sensor kinase CheA
LQAIDRLLGLEPRTAAAAPSKTALAAGVVSVNAAAPPDSVRVRTETLDRLLALASQLAALASSHEHALLESRVLIHSLARMERDWDSLGDAGGAPLRRLAESAKSSRVGRYLHNAGSQLGPLAMQARALGQTQRRNARNLRQLSTEIQQQIQRARMMSAEGVFDGFRRMVRDIARDEGKQVEFHCAGLDVEADRLVLQELKDPLMHLLRNAVCHGIENPEHRVRCGKAPAGNVSLTLEAPANHLLATVEDDGRGIDLEAVLQAGVAQGLLNETEGRSRPPDDLARLIFEPGFSTAPAVTALSGRGMGLSVVHEHVRRLHGEVNLQRGETAGTRMILRVPLTLSSHHFVLAGCCGQEFAIPASSIGRLCRVPIEAIETIEGRPAFSCDGRPVPIAALADLLEIVGQPHPPERRVLPIAVLCSGDARLGVILDSFLGLTEAIVRDLGLPSKHSGPGAGGILLDDGRVTVVLNPEKLIEAARRGRPISLGFAESKPQKKPPVILVVDDSITTRSLERTILESQGYQVRVAVDGLEALAQLRTERADLVITDIQMPRLDGYGLLEEIKKDRHLADIPVIVVTSMESREDQQRGLLLGADAFVVKRKFDQRELLETIRQIV